MRRARWLLPLMLIVSTACQIPADPEGTLERVRGGTLRVGIANNPPWVVLDGPQPEGVEVEIVKLLANELEARIEWHDGSEADLAAAVNSGELDLMAAGLTADSTLAAEVTLTHPYLTTQIVVATPGASPALQDVAGVRVYAEEGTEAAGLLDEKTDAVVERVADVSDVEGPVAIESYLLDDYDLIDSGLRLKESDRVVGVHHGENAWLVFVERFLLENTRAIDDILEELDRS